MYKNSKLLFTSGFWMLAIVLFLILRDLLKFLPEINLTGQRLTPQQQEIADQVNITGYFGKGAYFVYFTIQNNLLVSSVFIIASFIKNDKIKTYLLSLAVSYIFVVMVIFWTMIAPYLIWFLLWFLIGNIIFHAVVPILSITVWLLIKKEKLEYKYWYICLIYPILYLISLFLLYYVPPVHLGVYPMTNFNNPLFLNLGVVSSTLINFSMIFALTFAFSMAYLLTIRSTYWGSELKKRVI